MIREEIDMHAVTSRVEVDTKYDNGQAICQEFYYAPFTIQYNSAWIRIGILQSTLPSICILNRQAMYIHAERLKIPMSFEGRWPGASGQFKGS